MPMSDPTAHAADPWLGRALLASLLLHAVAMIAMATLLLPVLPGGIATSEVLRVTTLAAHPWRFRLGWVPWQLCALADLTLAFAMWRARWLPRLAAGMVVLFTGLAVLPDQIGQGLWVTQGVRLAQAAASSGSFAAYLRFEAAVFALTAGWGAVLYTLAGLAWTWSFAQAGCWSPGLTRLSLLLWPVMLGSALAPLLPVGLRPPPGAVAVGNAVGFALLLAWLALLCEVLLRRTQPFAAHGCAAPWRHPRRGPLGRFADALANSRLLRTLTQPLPMLAMVSDITDVIYVSYVVPAERLLPLVPAGLALQRLGPEGAYGLFSFLSFRHGHFGFRFLGPLRRLLPSPLQSNWRIHVRDPRTAIAGIYFVSNATTSTLHGLVARLLTDGMPMHVLEAGELTRSAEGLVRLTLAPGAGTAPDAVATLRPSPSPELPPRFAACFASFTDFLAYCVPQDRAMSTQLHRRCVTRHEIDLGIPLRACEPLVGEVRSRAAQAMVGEDTACVCFRVPSVRFLFARQVRDPLP
jgi:hypothetical protein